MFQFITNHLLGIVILFYVLIIALVLWGTYRGARTGKYPFFSLEPPPRPWPPSAIKQLEEILKAKPDDFTLFNIERILASLNNEPDPVLKTIGRSAQIVAGLIEEEK